MVKPGALPSRPALASPAAGAPALSLVNLAARQRMLSQRMILQTVLAAQGHEGKLAAAQQSLALFASSQTQLEATPDQLDPDAGQIIRAVYQGPTGVAGTISAFIQLMRTALDQIGQQRKDAPQSVARLVDQVDQLLEATNQATTAFDKVTQRRTKQLNERLTHIVTDIQTVAREAKVVSFNALVIAARAGSHGREFAVVANKLSDITTEVDGLARKALELADQTHKDQR